MLRFSVDDLCGVPPAKMQVLVGYPVLKEAVDLVVVERDTEGAGRQVGVVVQVGVAAHLFRDLSYLLN